MKILVATKETQGKRKNDFCFCKEWEIVKFGSECDGEKIDGHCGCRRSMVGIDTSKATTTMKVIETDISETEYAHRIHESAIRDGWTPSIDFCVKHALELVKIASAFEVGSVVERRGNLFAKRDPAKRR